MTVLPTARAAAARLRTADCDLDDFARLVTQVTALDDFPLATEVADNVLVYDADRLRDQPGHPKARRSSPPSWCGRSPRARESSWSAARSPTPVSWTARRASSTR